MYHVLHKSQETHVKSVIQIQLRLFKFLCPYKYHPMNIDYDHDSAGHTT